jgi:hypothetical protein
MREARTLISWVIALFVAVLLFWGAADVLAPQPPTRNHLFEVFRSSSDIAYFEPTGRLVAGALLALSAVLILLPVTRRMGAILGALVLAVLAVLIVQLIMLGVKVPVDSVGEGGLVTTVDTDPGETFYLVAGLLAASVVLIFVHPGRDRRSDAF